MGCVHRLEENVGLYWTVLKFDFSVLDCVEI